LIAFKVFLEKKYRLATNNGKKAIYYRIIINNTVVNTIL